MKKTLTLLALLSGLYATAQTEATFYTTKGSFTVELYDTIAPVTVDSFMARVNEKFYDGLIFHRVIDGFMIQGGDPAGNGSGNAGYSLPDEFHPMASNVQKTISMANSGPNTGSCQFFINLANNPHLDYDKQPLTSKHPVFGIVTQNFNVVQDIGKTPTTGNGGNPANKPLTDMVMDSIRITKYAASVNDFYGDNATVKAYPNPTDNVFSIDIPGKKSNVRITDIAGKEILNITTEQPTQLTVDMTGKKKGIYLITVKDEKGINYGRVILQ